MSADIKLSKLIKDMQKLIKDMENMLQCHQQKSVSQDKYIPTSYCEVGRTYRIPCEDNPNCYRKAIVTKLMEDFAVVCISFYGKLKGAVRTSFFQGIIYFNCGSNWHGKRLLFSEIFYL